MKNLRSVLDKLTTPISQQQGFVKASILLDWHLIVGDRFANFCQPEKISFPPQRRTGGRLTLKTSSAFALEISHLEPIIIERINRYFGYKAIDKLIIRNGKVTPPSRKIQPTPTVSAEQLSYIESLLEGIHDPALKATLMELGKGVYHQHAQKN
ncbi:DUF721 domain-containing protein [Candidatus Odyssella thessalonicensis]|uniref:DUF721 domain-containing protein n=1 Tax=Candidatus Odyssella thessalonicensis TaxID=84647 RepID=UPI000225A8F0|nr:DciA family protein [Candidatus Odyssella thessalonicensis]